MCIYKIVFHSYVYTIDNSKNEYNLVLETSNRSDFIEFDVCNRGILMY